MHHGSWPWLLTRMGQGPLEMTGSDLPDLSSDFYGLSLTWVSGWLKCPLAGDANMQPG